MRPHLLLSTILAGQALAYPYPWTSSSPSSSSSPREMLDRRDWPSINDFLVKLSTVFPLLNILVSDACGVISNGEAILASLFGIPDTQREPCGDVTVLFARGTCEPGNVGVIAGPWLFHSLQTKLGGRTLGVQGFDYPASVNGFLTGSKQPGLDLASMIKTTIRNCPNTKLVLSGYSQGGMVVHNAASNLDAATMSKVNAVVIFGDPYASRPVANIDSSKVMVICHAGDNICQGGDFILLPHLTYGKDADTAANFIMSLV